MKDCKCVNFNEVSLDVKVDKLEELYNLLGVSGRNTKAVVREELRKLLKNWRKENEK